MKMIIAVVQENRLDQVREELIAEEVYRITVTRVSGRGQQVGEEIYRGQKVTPDLLPKVRIDIAVNEDFVERACRAIIKGARSGPDGSIGDGKIFIMPLDECIRIRTSEKGREAI